MSSLPEHRAGETRIPGFCALCRSRCGCISVVQDGKLVAVEPNPEHPTGQALCAKGRAVPEVLVSGHHEKVRQWRLAAAEKITRERRPDLWSRYRDRTTAVKD